MSRTHRSHAQWLELLAQNDNGFVQAQQVMQTNHHSLTLNYGNLALTLTLHVKPHWLAQLVKSLVA
ncbi:hypothetical protein [Aliidiomarina celeris]|uniref:hypothetical protein n=1 Tax=Aliidiomarina celeris TaxID=2249428 RepID=UPI000DEA1FFF|nr:hypothetical protein [Aliidiomarina celeris]